MDKRVHRESARPKSPHRPVQFCSKTDRFVFLNDENARYTSVQIGTRLELLFAPKECPRPIGIMFGGRRVRTLVETRALYWNQKEELPPPLIKVLMAFLASSEEASDVPISILLKMCGLVANIYIEIEEWRRCLNFDPDKPRSE